MKKYLLITFIILSQVSSFATHIVGGDITVENIGGNNFIVTMRFYRDCLGGLAGFDNPVTLGVYDKINHNAAFQFTLPLISNQILALGDSCFTPTDLCVEEGIFRDTINIPNNANGYYLSWQRCCRNGIIQNIILPGDAGMVFYVEIPNPAIINSSPIFGSYPNAYLCNSQPNIQDFSAVDIDGDSLVYLLSTPLNGNATATAPIPAPSSGPYTTISWQTPYNASDMIGGTPTLSINSSTGILTANPATLGVFVFAVIVEEYRAGIKIGEIRRDIQYQVITCNTNQAPVFAQPTTSVSNISIIAGDSLCFPISATDINSDWVGLSASGELLNNPAFSPYVTFTPDSAIASVQSNFCFNSKCADIRDNPYVLTFFARDYSCYGTNTILNTVNITVLSPIDGQLDRLIPNVFTPNGDGINDFFKVNADNINDCFDAFEISIYNRWGQLEFKDQNFHFKWDGKNKSGQSQSDGVYFYIINGHFKNESFTYKGTIHLLR
jgi:gliding motility-associated-like protein